MSVPLESEELPAEVGEDRRLLDAVSAVMILETWRWTVDGLDRVVGRALPRGILGLEARGRLTVPPEQAYRRLAGQFRQLGYVLLLRREGGDDVLVAMQGQLAERAGRPWVAAAFFTATLLSVLWIGALYESDPFRPFNLLAGWPFAASLLGILLAHEMGHYVVARWQGLPASLPYFIPMPLSPLGTMGAVIMTKAPPRTRRVLLMLGASGPLAGMVVALPVLILGLSMSEIMPIPHGGEMLVLGDSLLSAGLAMLLFGQTFPSGGVDLFLHPVAMAGWAGMLVTAMNLIPAGQLDGGHIAYAVLGERARWLTWGVVAALLWLSLQWQGWLLWAGLVLMLGRVHSVPLDDVTPLRTRELALAAAALLLFVLVFIPVPMIIR